MATLSAKEQDIQRTRIRALKSKALAESGRELSVAGGALQGAKMGVRTLGDYLAARYSGLINGAQKIFSGKDIPALRAAIDQGQISDEQMMQDLRDYGGESLVQSYKWLRMGGVSAAEFIIGAKALKATKAGLGLVGIGLAGTKAASGTGATAAAGSKIVAAIKAPSVRFALGALTVGGTVAGTVAALRGKAKEPKVADALKPEPEDVLREPKGIQRDLRSPDVRTIEDFVEVALSKGGFGPERRAQAAAYRDTFAPIMGGSSPALNPYLGGVASGSAKEAMKFHTGTQEKQRAYQDALTEYNRSFPSRLQAAALPGWATGQTYLTAEAAKATALNKAAQTQQQNLINYYTRKSSDISRREATLQDSPDPNALGQLQRERQQLELEFQQGREALGMVEEKEPVIG